MPSATHHILFRLLLVFSIIPSLTRAQDDSSSAALSTVWLNNTLIPQNAVYFDDNTQVRLILLHDINSGLSRGPTYGCGFFCSPPCNAFLFAVFALCADNAGEIITWDISYSYPPQVVWSANRDSPVGANATLNFTAGGDLILRDANGTAVWSTGTSGKSVVGMNITAAGNLVVFDRSGAPVWQSFDHPTDSLVLGQTLREGQKLTPDISATKLTNGQLYITVLHDGLYAFVASDPPQSYYQLTLEEGHRTTQNLAYVKYTNGSLDLFIDSVDPMKPDGSVILTRVTPESTIQFMRFQSDGHLRTYGWTSNGWQMLDEVLGAWQNETANSGRKYNFDACSYPTVCGAYGICSNGQCSCPHGADGSSAYFEPVDDRQTSLGCSPVTPLSCQSMQEHRLLTVHNVSYFSMRGHNHTAKYKHIDSERCKQACLKNCSFKAAFFSFYENSSDGFCYLEREVFSLQNLQKILYTAYIKVQIPSTSPGGSNSSIVPHANKKATNSIGTILGIVGAVILVMGIAVVFIQMKKVKEEDQEDDFSQIPGMPARFSHEELKLATNNFSVKLGEGAFGSVYEGKLGDEKIAVKQFNSVGQGRKEFLAEVQTIGSIHHINLVRLIGFCAEKSHRLLVYEHMCNGSLDRWIFHKGLHGTFNWQAKYKIITDVAKGLSYLHEECRQRIAHLDIKPQNILLDENFNAKVSDFGLAKLIDRDQKQVMTRMRGTPGYLAPEWLTSVITEKAYIYSFGVVVVEIVCGRKNLDYSQPEESIHLISLLQEMIKAGRWEDIVQSNDNDMNLHKNEAIEMIKLAVWCLQVDSGRRPSMSTVVKVLEGETTVQIDLDYDIVTRGTIVSRNSDDHDPGLDASRPPSTSLLSGPR